MATRKYSVGDSFIHKKTKRRLSIIDLTLSARGDTRNMYVVQYDQDKKWSVPIPASEEALDEHFMLLKDDKLTEALYL